MHQCINITFTFLILLYLIWNNQTFIRTSYINIIGGLEGVKKVLYKFYLTNTYNYSIFKWHYKFDIDGRIQDISTLCQFKVWFINICSNYRKFMNNWVILIDYIESCEKLLFIIIVPHKFKYIILYTSYLYCSLPALICHSLKWFVNWLI